MSPLAIPTSLTAALPALNVHPHGHGHKKGSDLLDTSTDSTSSTAAQVPVAAAQNLFSKAFTALERLIGLTPPAASTAAASSPAAAANTNSAAASIAAPASKINLMA